ncbi:MAG: thioredoxin domain-containing protein [Aeromicrobium sp.]|uniref:DsbA family protein n=1 Tax=Aeromicrobium sp. TaxID=1871063 RepID=UPI0039E2ED91
MTDARRRLLALIAALATLFALAACGDDEHDETSSDDSSESVEKDDDDDPADFEDDWHVALTPDDLGGEVAPGYEPVVVELYEDFQCPHCALFEEEYGEQLVDMVAAGEIELRYRPFSFLDDVGGSPNDYSKRATNAAICVYEEHGAEAYAQFHALLFSRQPAEGTPGPEDDELIAAAASLEFDGIDDCVNGQTYFDRIEDAKDDGVDRGVTGTPTVYVDGEMLTDPADVVDEAEDAVADAQD